MHKSSQKYQCLPQIILFNIKRKIKRSQITGKLKTTEYHKY